MAFPRISTKATNITMTSQLETLLVQKFEPLGKLLDPHGDERCEIELEKTAEHQSGKIFRAEVNLYSGGRLFRTEATEEQIEKAIDRARNELKNELQRVHGRHKSLLKRGHQAIKNMLRFGK